MSYFILDGFFVVSLFLKDLIDEKRLHQNRPPIGPTWFEHTPFAFMVGLHAIISSIIETNEIIAIIKFIFGILLFIDVIWDSVQEVRFKSFKK